MIRINAERMPFGMGPCVELMSVGMRSFSELVSVGTGKGWTSLCLLGWVGQLSSRKMTLFAP